MDNSLAERTFFNFGTVVLKETSMGPFLRTITQRINEITIVFS